MTSNKVTLEQRKARAMVESPEDAAGIAGMTDAEFDDWDNGSYLSDDEYSEETSSGSGTSSGTDEESSSGTSEDSEEEEEAEFTSDSSSSHTSDSGDEDVQAPCRDIKRALRSATSPAAKRSKFGGGAE
jgi:hypothetical protein